MRYGLTQHQVDEVADRLLFAGERPRVERVRQELGTGSMTTVSRLLDVWWAALGPRLQAQRSKMELPDAPPAVAALATQLWEQALGSATEHAQAALAVERDALAAARLEADARVAAAHQAAAEAQAAEQATAHALVAARERLDDVQRLVDEQVARLADLATQRDAAAERATHFESELTAVRAQLNDVRAEAHAQRDAHAAHLRAVEDRAHGEIDRARQEAKAVQRALKSAESSHGLELGQLQGELAQSRTAGTAIQRELAAEQARRETLDQQLGELRASLSDALTPWRKARKGARAAPRPATRSKKSK